MHKHFKSRPKRERLLMDPEWRFYRGDIPLPKGHGGWTKSGNFSMPPIDPRFDDTAWRQINLPHDFVVEGEFCSTMEVAKGAQGIAGMVEGQNLYTMHGSLPSGVSWYRKTFNIPFTDLGRRLSVEFDGVARNCTVWLNKHCLGQHTSGYTGFRYDISDIAVYGGANTLVLRADAGEYEGWFYEGGGIYRHGWLVKHEPLHIAPHGVFITSEVTPQDNFRHASVTIRTILQNDGEQAQACRLSSRVVDHAGKSIVTAEEPVQIQAGQSIELCQTVTLASPRLWSVDSPNLYSLVSTLMTEDREIDSIQTRFGIRTIRFDPQKGFFLNGRPVSLKGVCCHQDHAGVGVALPDRLQEFRIEKLKEMGCNAYRCSHNPPTPELLDACDRLGMLVMDENRLLSSSPENLNQLESLVLRDRNHPSVILWSLANEEMAIQGTDMAARIAATLKRRLRKLDTTRPVTVAMNGGWGKPISRVLDVQGCNYIFCGDTDTFHQRYPDKPVVFSESASTVCTRGIYSNDKAKGYVSAYDVNNPLWGATAEKNWLFCVKRPWIAGTFVWTGFDYRGEPTPYGWPCINSHFGILDMCGFPKDNFYYYQAWWSNRTVLHLFPHWNWQGREGEKIDVWVHSNCDSVELFLNGHSLGRRKTRSGRHLEWKVRYAPGVLSAKGWTKGKCVAVTRVETTGAPSAIRLIPDRVKLRADGEDVALMTVAVTDDKGRIVPDADNEIAFSVSLNATILGVGNGDPSSHEPDKAARRRVFNGLCQVIIQTGKTAGPIKFKAYSNGLRDGSVTFQAGACAPRPFVPAISVSQVAQRLTRFACSHLYRQQTDIRHVQLPPALSYRPVTSVSSGGFCDIREFHGKKDGVVFIRTVFNANRAISGQLAYGADGPVKVWVNGKAMDCQPDAANPAIEDQYTVSVRWQKGANQIIFGLSSNNGNAWGIFAGILPFEK